jgi:hypothetical protein
VGALAVSVFALIDLAESAADAHDRHAAVSAWRRDRAVQALLRAWPEPSRRCPRSGPPPSRPGAGR